MKKFLTFIAMLVMALALCSCGSTEETVEDHDLSLVSEEGEAAFVIVYPNMPTDEMLEVVDYLQAELNAATGLSFKVREDMAAGPKDTRCEILLGATDREESTAALEEIKYAGDYAISTKGNKIIISSMLIDGLKEASAALVEQIKTGGTTIAKGYSYSGQCDNMIKYIPAYKYGTFSNSYDCGDDAMMLIYDSEEAGYTSYLSDLTADGYTKYSENKIGSNSFAVYTKDDVEVNVMCLPAKESVRITAEPKGYLPALAPESVIASVTPSITMLGLEGYDTDGTANQIGMSFIFQTGEGHFIIYDGGHKQDLAADQIMDKLKELAGDNEIIIDAWVLTHGHGDHIRAFEVFTDKYASEVTLELLVYNFPAQFEFDNASEAVRNAIEIIAECATRYEGCETFKMHMGQVLYCGDATITCYGSWEMIAPISLEYFNNSSVITMVDLGGQRINMLADCGPLQTPVLTTIYTTAEMKSDIVQIGHHGYMGMSSDFYKLINPDYAFWPGGSRSYENYKDENYNTWVVNHVKQLWVAKADIYTEQLPITY